MNQEFDKAGVTRLSKWHLDVVYRTNTAIAYSGGQIARYSQLKSEFPYWRYSAIKDRRTRPSHRRLDGKIFKNGDFRFWPPLGYNCRCEAIPITAREAAEKGLTAPDPVTPEEQSALRNAEFIGNKNSKFMSWLESKKKRLSKEAISKLDEAIENLRESVIELNRKDYELLMADSDMVAIRQEFKKRKLDENAKALGLTEEEGLLVTGYTSTSYHKQLNRYLRGLKIEDDGRVLRFWRAYERQLKAVLEKLPIYTENNGLVKRVIDVDLTPEQINLYQEGNRLIWRNFTSTSKLNPVEKRLNFRIQSKRGVDISSLSLFNEGEVLIKPSRFEVLKKSIESNGVTTLILREL